MLIVAILEIIKTKNQSLGIASFLVEKLLSGIVDDNK